MQHPTDDLRIKDLKPLLSAGDLDGGDRRRARRRARLIAARPNRDRAASCAARTTGLLVVVGPCSIHDPVAGLDYARRLVEAAARYRDDLLHRDARVLREAAHDGRLEGPDQRSAPRRQLRDQRGPARSRARFLLDVIELGLPAGTRVARSDHAAVHGGPGRVGRDRRAHDREPGAPRAGVRACRCRSASRTAPTATVADRDRRASARPRTRTASSASTKQGLAAIVATTGNPRLPRHPARRQPAARTTTRRASRARASGCEGGGLPPRVMVDCSHANSDKDHERQPRSWREVARAGRRRQRRRSSA